MDLPWKLIQYSSSLLQKLLKLVERLSDRRLGLEDGKERCRGLPTTENKHSLNARLEKYQMED